ncbi:hypothetical protein [Nostoc sp. UHCC 0251]|uniref:hypothetical protein n=1 Tax=Nostoc sp. UHCC 0251 TaxID=3110240 RepID=UPI002B215DC9|nr:hypothetical protein [Nostoc sp. UHCC 0251]MEA5628244.1 hypothetical protein [Nostoc sp. UHCC 0251]
MRSKSLLVEDLNLFEELDNQTAECVGGGQSRPQKILIAPLPPPGCPPGWIPALPPLNPQLGCIPNTIVSRKD